MRFGHSYCISIIAMLATTVAAFAAAPEIGIPTVASTSQEEADEAAWNRFVAASAKSSDLRLRVIFSVDGLEKRNDGFYLHESIPLESLVDQARGSNDPLVLAMLAARCGETPNVQRCDALDFARRWTVADTQNQLAWVALASELQRRGDSDAARAAFERAAQASVWHEQYADMARAIARALPRTLTPRERLRALHGALATAAARSVSMEPYGYLRAACKEPSTRDACARILETMFRDGDTLIGTAVSARLAQAAGLLDDAVRARKQRFNATYWAVMQFPVLEDAELDDPAVLARAVDQVGQRVELGEMRWGQRLLLQSGVSEPDAAARFVAAHPSYRTP